MCTRKRRAGYALRVSGSCTFTLARRHRSTQGRRTVNPKKEMCRTGLEFKTHPHSIPATVHHWISKMKVALIVMISTYVWNLGQANPLVGDKEPLLSKYSVQLFDCGVPGKIQLLQIPETCEDRSTEIEREILRETYVLSPRKLKKTSGVMCHASVLSLGDTVARICTGSSSRLQSSKRAYL